MVIRQNYSYFMESNGYYDADFTWHRAYDYDYGTPLSEPVRAADSGAGTISYSRRYNRCVVSVLCNVSKCTEAGGPRAVWGRDLVSKQQWYTHCGQHRPCRPART